MNREWKEYSLEDITELIVDCPHSTPKWTDDGVVVLRNQNIRNGKLDITSPSFTNIEGYESRIKRATPETGDLVLTREAPMGEVCQIPEGLKCCLGQRMVLIRAKTNALDPWYLLFAMQSQYVQHQIGWNEGTGTTISNIRIPNIKAFQIPLPPLPEQKRIAHILGSLDDKIELNRKMNETLEQMAQALFKSWFVDFDSVIDNAILAGNPIPDQFAKCAAIRKKAFAEKKDSDNSEFQHLFPDSFELADELGWIPKGWEVKTLGEISKFVKGKVSRESLTLNNYISTENMEQNRGGVTNASSLPSTYTVPIFAKGHVLVSNIRPYFKKIWLATFSGGRSNDVLAFEAIEKITQEFLYCLLYQDQFFAFMMASAKGSKMPRGDKIAIMGWPIAYSSKTIFDVFSQQVKASFVLVDENKKHSEYLASIRDTLLPKLLSGELNIENAEKEMEGME